MTARFVEISDEIQGDTNQGGARFSANSKFTALNFSSGQLWNPLPLPDEPPVQPNMPAPGDFSAEITASRFEGRRRAKSGILNLYYLDRHSSIPRQLVNPSHFLHQDRPATALLRHRLGPFGRSIEQQFNSAAQLHTSIPIIAHICKGYTHSPRHFSGSRGYDFFCYENIALETYYPIDGDESLTRRILGEGSLHQPVTSVKPLNP